MAKFSSIELYILFGILALVAYKIISLLAEQRRLRKLMPPGPAGLPLIGNVLQLPRFPWLRLTEWKEQYGPIFSLNLAGQPVVIVNDFTTAGDLLDRRSNIYSDRPRLIVAGEIFTGGLALPFLRYGNRWRRMRKAAHEGFNIRACATYQPLQQKATVVLVSSLLTKPDRWYDHLKQSVVSSVLSVVYGWPPMGEDSDPAVQRITTFMHRLTTASLPGAHLVESVPSLLHFPDCVAGWKRKAKQGFKTNCEMFEGFVNDVTVKMRSGSFVPCFASSLIEGSEKLNLNSQETAWMAGIIFGGAVGTTTATLENFVLAMTLYPDVMRRAQAQIDSIVGRGRMPTFADREELPYIDAVVKEVLRWRPIGPMGVPRCTTQDDWYKEYFIPKGTIVLYNVWAMNRDPAYFPDYDEFRPERFLDSSGQLSNTIPDTHGLGHYTYGSGRRICVGKDLANQSLFINIATILWAFDICKALDSNGHPITPSRTEWVDEGLEVRPAPFECTILPRGEEVVALIQSGARE